MVVKSVKKGHKMKKITDKFIRELEKNPKIIFVIHPTRYDDYNILALGDEKSLKKLDQKDKYFHYIDGMYGKIVVLDTCDCLDDSESVLNELKKDFGK